MNLAQAFARAAETNAARTALYCGGRTFSFAELRRQADGAAGSLQRDHRVTPGARVGLWLKNSSEFVVCVLGVLQAGAVVVPVNRFLKPVEVVGLLDDAGAETLITDATEEDAAELAAALPKVRILPLKTFAAAFDSAEAGPCEREGSDLAVLIYTSGTTGRPKGAMLSHDNLLHNVESSRLALEIVPEDRMGVMLPMFHSFMICVGILLPLLNGAAIVVIRPPPSPRNVTREIIEHAATVLPSIPQFYRALVSADAPVPASLRLCVSGAAPLPVAVLEAFSRKFPFPLVEGYGLSEASPEVTKNPLRGPRKPGSIGLPIPNVEVSIQNDAGELLPAGENGELCVRGGNVMLGYWKQPEETARVMRDGWLLTGDIARRDADGYLFITDRKKDMLLVNGVSVYPREIEEALHQFPGAREAAVIGVPDPRKGEQPLAFVAADEDVTLDERELIRFLRSKLADYKVPRKVVFLPALPRNAGGKILKTVLREMARNRSDVFPAQPAYEAGK